jgi:hypothetical protein
VLFCLIVNLPAYEYWILNQNSMAGTIAIPVLDTPQPLEPDNLDLDRPLAMC